VFCSRAKAFTTRYLDRIQRSWKFIDEARMSHRRPHRRRRGLIRSLQQLGGLDDQSVEIDEAGVSLENAILL